MSTIDCSPIETLSLPNSPSIVQVQAIDTTLQLYVRSANFLDPVIPGHETYNCPTLAFLITNPQTGKHVLFDAGGRKDYWNYSPLITARFESGINVKGLRIDKGIDEVLTDAGVDLNDVESIIWSHWHFDHIGDSENFPTSTKIIVGPGFKDNLLPGYPANENSALLETDYANHELVEIAFADDFKIGQFRAHDFFGDGSFYLLDVPGHAIGHMCGLARTTENTFLLMGADTCHFAGSIRPSERVPLPKTIDSQQAGLDSCFPKQCACSMFTACHPAEEEVQLTSPWYKASKVPTSTYCDPATADISMKALQDFDASSQVFICIAHDPCLFDILPLLNQDSGKFVNEWRLRGYKEQAKWRFLNELPRNGKPGKDPIVLGYWRDGKQVDSKTAFQK